MSARRDGNDAETASAHHAAAASTESHPKPSPREARERSHLEKHLDERPQRAIWVSFFVVLAALLVLGAALALRHYAHATN